MKTVLGIIAGFLGGVLATAMFEAGAMMAVPDFYHKLIDAFTETND